MSDYIKLYRSLLEWEWYSDINTTRLFIHMILKANWKEGKFKGQLIPRGSFPSSIGTLADETKLTNDEIRTAIKHLLVTNDITKQNFSKYTVFTVVNYEKFQNVPKQITEESTTNSHSVPILFPTIEEKKEVKKERNKNILCKNEASELFEALWKMYPNKRGKTQVTENDKQKLLEIGLEEMTRSINRYKRYIEANKDWYKPLNGSTFFKGRYQDYIGDDYEEPKQPVKKSGFNNFQQNDYDFEKLEEELLDN